jgi:uncharacterized protein YbbC (DUF1343 family)
MMGIKRRHVLAGIAGGAATPLVAATTAEAVPADRSRHRRGPAVTTGVERLIADNYAAVRGEKVGIVTNPTGVLPDLRHEVDVMADDDHIDLVAVFGPEHGFRGSAQAGGSEGSYKDPQTGLPVYDTYQKSISQIAKLFDKSGVDVVMYDIQDVGARFYTYIWTLYESMAAAAKAGKRFLVLDRPNPITGHQAYGPVMHPKYESFVELKPISQQHGMTVGELAKLYNGEFLTGEVGKKVDLDVVEMRGWRREDAYGQTGLPWVLPSPNMPTVDSAFVYPGTCMFEGTNLSEGRGTTRPFEIIGAPWVDYHWAEKLNDLKLPGAQFRETYFNPTFSKFKGKTCGGVQLHLTDRPDRREFRPVRTAVAMLVTAKQLYSKHFGWREDNWIDNLTGSDRLRKQVDAGKSTEEIVAAWNSELAKFRRTRKKYLIYQNGS